METKKRRDEGGKGGLKYHKNLLPLYGECIWNARQLLEEAHLLLDAGRNARAFALAFTAYEEIGKSQVVADAYYGLVSTSELTDAFTRHDVKAAYLGRSVSLKLGSRGEVQEATIEYQTLDSKPLIQQRLRSLYVDSGVDYEAISPNDAITLEVAEEMLQLVHEELHAIDWAEELNGQIGTKGLWK
jgi:AbiV family abortive infection protein